ncbi:hypothetical protein LCGC14_0488530 [marine sediment metagenome]|uniref:HNH nuclease domain-containing protein n=1 Tax=marine sediment metagenome TaxID=412755 RepID=A0A0F9UU61_9ZZZZ
MKKTPLKRKAPLRKRSKGQEVELGRRRLLKWELYLEQEGKCANPKCGKFMDYNAPVTADNYPHLAHKKRLGKGGETTKANTSVLCAECHSNKDHLLRNVYGENPSWT